MFLGEKVWVNEGNDHFNDNMFNDNRYVSHSLFIWINLLMY